VADVDGLVLRIGKDVIDWMLECDGLRCCCRTFFRVFKINLEKGCPFRPDNFECFLQDCSVCECEPDEIPRTWLESPDGLNQQDQSSITSHAAWITSAGNHSINAQRQHLERVDRSEARAGESFREWKTTNENSWIEQDDDTENMVYINLLKNPERFTGYSGESARRVWNAIHQENWYALVLFCE
jgi:ERO1-like protein alpha